MDDLLRKQDLVNNPMIRVPVCLCLDVSDSMNRVVRGETKDTGRKVFSDGQEWTVVTGGITAINDMVEGVRLFYDSLRNDDVARYSAEICLVTFGGDSAKLIFDFATLDLQPPLPDLKAEGETPMGEAINMALDCLETRKQHYKDAGDDYFQPWLVLMTDGSPNGAAKELERAISRTVDLINQRKLTIFPIGIGEDADMDVLRRFSPLRTPLRLKNMNFKGFFEWLGKSVQDTSKSMPGEQIELDTKGILGWGTL